MDIKSLIAQINGKLPEGFVRPTILETGLATCSQRRCKRKVAIKRNGTPAKSCQSCLDRRAASCRRRRAALAAEGGCRRCAYRKRLPGDFLCERCREDRDAERAQKRQDAIDAAVIDEFAAKPETVHRASNLDMGALERQTEAAGDCCILVAAAGPGAGGGARVGALAVGFGLAV